MKTILAAVFAFALHGAAHASGEDLKGLRMGMPQAEALQIVGNPKTFTIAGVAIKNHLLKDGKKAASQPLLTFQDGTLVKVMFWYDAVDWFKLHQALKAKFTGFSCNADNCRAGDIGLAHGGAPGEPALLIMIPVDDLVAADKKEADAKDAIAKAAVAESVKDL